jgi:hypothetical protein
MNRKLNAELNWLLAAAGARNLLAPEGVTPAPGAPEEYRAAIAGDCEERGEVIRKSRARVD